MSRASIWTYGKPNSVQEARKFGPQNTCYANKSEIGQIILRDHFRDLIFVSKKTNEYQS
jgi:hypothetical protein